MIAAKTHCWCFHYHNTLTRTNVYHNGCRNNNGKAQTCIDIVMMVNTCLVSPPPGALGQVSLKCFQSWIPKSYLGIRRSLWAKSKLIMLFAALNVLSSSTQKGRKVEFSCCFEKHRSCCFARQRNTSDRGSSCSCFLAGCPFVCWRQICNKQISPLQSDEG